MVIVTCGAKGVWLVSGEDPKPAHIPAFKVRAIDTTGWQTLRTFDGKPIVFVAGSAANGLLIYSVVPLARCRATAPVRKPKQ